VTSYPPSCVNLKYIVIIQQTDINVNINIKCVHYKTSCNESLLINPSSLTHTPERGTCTLEAQYITAEKLQLCQVLFLSGLPCRLHQTSPFKSRRRSGGQDKLQVNQESGVVVHEDKMLATLMSVCARPRACRLATPIIQ
jgi:hypothetical protein